MAEQGTTYNGRWYTEPQVQREAVQGHEWAVKVWHQWERQKERDYPHGPDGERAHTVREWAVFSGKTYTQALEEIARTANGGLLTQAALELKDVYSGEGSVPIRAQRRPKIIERACVIADVYRRKRRKPLIEEKVRHVRTPEGVRKYKRPIGAPIEPRPAESIGPFHLAKRPEKPRPRGAWVPRAEQRPSQETTPRRPRPVRIPPEDVQPVVVTVPRRGSRPKAKGDKEPPKGLWDPSPTAEIQVGPEYASQSEFEQSRRVAIQRAMAITEPPNVEEIGHGQWINRMRTPPFNNQTPRIDMRGNPEDRAGRKAYLFDVYGGQPGGYIPCPGCGRKVTNEERGRYPQFQEDKIIPTGQGGRYQNDQLQPMCTPCNNTRGDADLPWLPTPWAGIQPAPYDITSRSRNSSGRRAPKVLKNKPNPNNRPTQNQWDYAQNYDVATALWYDMQIALAQEYGYHDRIPELLKERQEAVTRAQTSMRQWGFVPILDPNGKPRGT